MINPRRFLTIMTRTKFWKPRYYDIGVNFSDSMFQGYYNGSTTSKHPCDIQSVIERAHLFHVDKMLITALTIKESEDHFELCEKYSNQFDSTAGVHPCSVASEFYKLNDEIKQGDDGENSSSSSSSSSRYSDELRDDVNIKLEKLKNIIIKGYKLGHIKAFGEIGLDYDRLHYSSKHQQCEMLIKQLDLLHDLQTELNIQFLPLFLHMRSACDDFIKILKPYIEKGIINPVNAVVHSFTGTEQELNQLLELGFYIGVNGCSLKTEENLQVVKKIPINKLLIETDAPWCEIRKSHAGYKFIKNTIYPNKFYPELLEDVKQLLPSSIGKNSLIKLHENLPFPSIKKENFWKHSQFVQKSKENSNSTNPELLETRIGVLADPMIKSRNEPVNVGLVAQIICGLHDFKDDTEIENFIDTVFENSCQLFKT